jgi:N-acetylglutamate synthase-like GNAT family acetyltransferase
MSLDPSSLAIRRATVADAAQLASLRYQFRSELAEAVEDESAFVARMTAWLSARIEQPHWQAWVVSDAANQIYGHIFAQFVEKIPNPVVEAETIVYLTNVYIVPPLRNRGLGTRLLAAALADCDRADIDTLILWPSTQSESLYRRHGFRPPTSLLERPRLPTTEPGP